MLTIGCQRYKKTCYCSDEKGEKLCSKLPDPCQMLLLLWLCGDVIHVFTELCGADPELLLESLREM